LNWPLILKGKGLKLLQLCHTIGAEILV